MDAHELEKTLQWRYATKCFDPKKKISDTNWQALEKAFLLCPSSYGLQPWRFLVVENEAIREKLKAASWKQAQVTDASHYVVLLYKEKLDEKHIAGFVDRTAEVRAQDRQTLLRFEQMMVNDLLGVERVHSLENWAKNQIYIAMGFVLQAAAVLKIDACPMEGIDAIEYDRILGLAGSGYKTLVSIAFGYRDLTDAYQSIPKVRFEPKQIIHHIK